MKKIIFVLLAMLFVFSFVGVVEAAGEEDASPLFYLVAGSFRELENAEKQQEELYLHRYYSRIMGYPIDGVLYWRVIVGEDTSRENLLGLKDLLAEDGFESFLAYDSGQGPERPVYDPEPVPVPIPEEEKTRQFILELIAWLQIMLEKY
jgi:hypothetical protein